MVSYKRLGEEGEVPPDRRDEANNFGDTFGKKGVQAGSNFGKIQ